MNTNVLRKSLVVAVILLFIGVAVAPSINANNTKNPLFDRTMMEKNSVRNIGIRTSLTFNTTNDSFISMKTPEINYGSNETTNVRNRYGNESDDWEMDTLIRFDISIPNNEVVVRATLHLFYWFHGETDPVGRVLKVYRITSDWNESVVTWNNKPTISTELSSNSTVPSNYGYIEWDVTDDVKSFISEQVENFGWQIMDEQHWGNNDIPVTCFRTKEYNDVHPYLEVEVTSPPTVPERPSGQTSGKIGVEYTYTTYTTDADGDLVYYKWDWGDGNFSDWLGPYDSGEEASASHIWQKGSYEIRVKAKDINNVESYSWSEPLKVKMPYTSKISFMNQGCNQYIEIHLIRELINSLRRETQMRNIAVVFQNFLFFLLVFALNALSY